MSKVHIITAVSRWGNLDFYLERLEPLGILWHPIIDHPCSKLEQPWIEPFYCNNSPEYGDVFYRRLNAFMHGAVIDDNAYYVFLNDDDWLSENVPSILTGCSNDVVFAGMLRGNHPVPGHPITPLTPYPGVRAGSIGVEQIILKGCILRTVSFNITSGMADGILAEELQVKYPVRYMPELVMLFNYLEPGRW